MRIVGLSICSMQNLASSNSEFTGRGFNLSRKDNSKLAKQEFSIERESNVKRPRHFVKCTVIFSHNSSEAVNACT